MTQWNLPGFPGAKCWLPAARAEAGPESAKDACSLQGISGSCTPKPSLAGEGSVEEHFKPLKRPSKVLRFHPQPLQGPLLWEGCEGCTGPLPRETDA